MKNTMNLDELVRFSFPDACLILLTSICMCFYVAAHVLVHLAFTWHNDWLRLISTATSFKWNGAFHLLSAPGSNPYSVRFRVQAFFQLGHLHIISFHLSMFMLLHHAFLIFLFTKKSITPWIIIQITWDFLHIVPYHVYLFMDIFPEFVLG